MSFTKIFEVRNSFEIFKQILPPYFSLDIDNSRMERFFTTIGKEFILLREFGKQIAMSKWLGVPSNSPNISPGEIVSGSDKIKLVPLGGDSLEDLGSILNQPMYKIINEIHSAYRNRLIATVENLFGGGSIPSLKNALKFATQRFDGLGAHPEGYTPEIIETKDPVARIGNSSTPPEIEYPGGTETTLWFRWSSKSVDPPIDNKPIFDLFGLENDHTRFVDPNQERQQLLHFIVKFTMDNTPFNGNVAITGNLDDGYYNSEDDKKYLGTQTGYAGTEIPLGNKGGGNTFNPILIFDLEPLLEYGISEVTECYLDFYININFTGIWGGFYAHLIDDNNPSYTDEESGEPSYLEDNKVLFSDDIAGSGWYSNCIVSNPNIADLVNMYLQRDRLEGETRMGIYLRPVSDTDNQFLGFERIEHNSGYEAFIDVTYFTDHPTDYEYWGGKYFDKTNLANPNYLNNYNEEFVNNYLFLRDLVSTLKMAGTTFEIQIEEV